MTCKEAIYSNDVYDYITDYPVNRKWESLEAVICSTDVEDSYSILYLERPAAFQPESEFLEYQSVPKLYGLTEKGFGTGQMNRSGGVARDFDLTALRSCGILRLQSPPLQLTGKGVVTCLIDTGIDYTNPVFFDSSGRSRILAIWDQTIEDGTPPQGFAYGAEYHREEIERAAKSTNPYDYVPSRDEIGHGTALASVMAGSNLSMGMGPETERYHFVGASPDADLVIVKLKQAKSYLKEYYRIPDESVAFQENDILLAVQYCDSFVKLFQRPEVICLCVGTNMGDHAGSSALDRYLSQIAIRRNRVIVVSGGNEGNARHHYQGDLSAALPFPPGSSAMSPYKDVEVRVEEGNKGFLMELWGSLPDVVNVSVRTPGGEMIPPIRLGLRQNVIYGFVYEKSRIAIDSFLVEPSSGEELMLFRIYDPTPGIWVFRVQAAGEVYNGIFHIWLPVNAFLNREVYFLNPSAEVTLTEPSPAPYVITVASYDADSGGVYPDSGRGFGRTGMRLPELAAPGVEISTVLGSYTGTGFAAAITAGAAAQLLQWCVVERNQQFAESLEIQSYLIRGAVRRDNQIYPNREWGYGKLSMTGVFDALVGYNQ